PKMMTVVAIMAGLFAIMWSTGTGSEMMQRIAVPMIGGMISSTLLHLIVIPANCGVVKGVQINAWEKTRALLRGRFFQAMVEEGGAFARHDLFDVGLLRASALADLLGPALLCGLAMFRRHRRGINQLLRGRRRRKNQAAGNCG